MSHVNLFDVICPPLGLLGLVQCGQAAQSSVVYFPLFHNLQVLYI